MKTRRQFIQTTALAAAASTLPVLVQGAASSTPSVFAVFTKHLIGLNYDRLAEVLAEIGVTAIEAPIRPKGHVEPEQVEDELPKLVEALQRRNITIAVMTTGINAVEARQFTEPVLRTARALGITRYRMAWYKYDLKKPIWTQLDEIKPKLRDLVAISRDIGILPCYQNHSGREYVGAPIWDMAMLMRGYKPDELAWCFDIMHATVEGSSSWPIQVNLVRDQIGVAYFKDFAWEGKGHKMVPMGEGVVSREYISMLKKSNYTGPLSLHIEYLNGSLADAGYLQSALAATKRDLDLLRTWWM